MPDLRWTVTCHTEGCAHYLTGWQIIGPGFEAYHCAQCARLMYVTAGWAEAAAC